MLQEDVEPELLRGVPLQANRGIYITEASRIDAQSSTLSKKHVG